MSHKQSIVETLTGESFALGTSLKTVSETMAEALGYTSVDFLFVDRQHGTMALERLENVFRATDMNDLPVVVRVPRDDPSMITYLLDCGARGIVLPQVENPETVREASTHVRYEDGRSLGSTTRAANFGHYGAQEYIDYVNEDLALLPMVESQRGLDNVERIAELAATTAVIIGPGDLSFSLGVERWGDEHLDIIESTLETVTGMGSYAGVFLPSTELVERFSDTASFVIYGSDVGMATSHIDGVASEFSG